MSFLFELALGFAIDLMSNFFANISSGIVLALLDPLLRLLSGQMAA